MFEPRFSSWVRWKDRRLLTGMEWPGVYALALSETDLSGKKFDWADGIIYFGMTNSQGGLSARLKQFDNTIRMKEGHGGACRVRHKHRKPDELVAQLFVSTCFIECTVTSNTPDDLLKMGEVVYLEYYCFAEYARRFGRRPEFNDWSAPKWTAADVKAANASTALADEISCAVK